ncbi:MAG: hypothetical protein KQH63_11010 [Desulfobulbaceae bacterium]|nr:hypothetical protein [Desulfobulbaceae bacterium]
MADEQNTTSDIDDWLDDLDDSDEFSGELDQDNIDALLGGGLDKEEQQEAKSAEEEEEASEELDQSNIDALLGDMNTGAEEAADVDDPELDQANIDALLSGADEKEEESDEAAAELDQANIDALLGGTDEKEEESDEAAAELDQANIDALLSGTDEEEESAEAGDELDQANIDALLGGGDEQDAKEDIDLSDSGDVEELGTQSVNDFLAGADAEDDGLDVDQDEIDQLFSGLDDEDDEVDDPFESEDMDLADVLGSDDEEFLELGGVADDEDITVGSGEGSGDETVATALQSSEEGEGDGKGFTVPAFLSFLPASIDRTVASIIVGCLVLLIGVGFYFLGSGDDDEQAIPGAGEEIAEMSESQVAPNFIPSVNDSSYQMPEGGGEVAILLKGLDEDGDELTYSVTSQPMHGRLSGEAPALVYLPNRDFPGEDHFEFTASDGKDTSSLASVVISGPNLVELAAREKEEKEKEKKSLRPRNTVLAKSLSYKTKSTEKVEIDWARIWRQANYSAYNPKVHVEIESSGLSGRLTEMKNGVSYYKPDPFFEGKEVIRYRFKRGGLSSRTARLTMQVTMGSPAPEIRIQKMAQAYQVGQTVFVDARLSRDEAREKLRFGWEQIAGVPVPVEILNEEASFISFTMPSTFYTGDDFGPILRLTVVDETGKSDVQEVKIRTVSRRQAALWRGVRGGVADDPPLDGRLMPWPYED